MSLSTEEQILRELKKLNAQQPGAGVLRAFGLLVLIGVIFVTAAMLLNGLMSSHQVVQKSPAAVKRGHVRPRSTPHLTTIKESFE